MPNLTAYRATVTLLLPADIKTYGEACDYLSMTLTEGLMGTGIILDWEYVNDDPTLVDLGDPDEWDTERRISTCPVVL